MRSLLALAPLALLTVTLGGCAAPDDSDPGGGAEAMTTGSAYRSKLTLGTYSAAATTTDGLGAFLWIRNDGKTQLATLDVDGATRCGGAVDVPIMGGPAAVEDETHSCKLTLTPNGASVGVTLSSHGGADQTFQVAPLDLSNFRGKWKLSFTVGGDDVFEIAEVTDTFMRSGRPNFIGLTNHPRSGASAYQDELHINAPFVLVHRKDGKFAVKTSGYTLVH